MKITLTTLFALVVALWAASAVGIFYFVNDWGQRGQFGDLFGAVNALFSGLAFAGVYSALTLQREQMSVQQAELSLQRQEVAATRAELEGQRHQMQRQSETFVLQRFEDTFFALLRVHGDIVNAMDLQDSRGRITRSRDCFRVWYIRLKQHHAEGATYSPEKTLETVQTIYEKFYHEHQAEVGHYFRHLYHIIKFVSDSAVPDKPKYTSLVRAQLSAYEHILLFYNCLSTYGIQKFKPLVEQFALLENMPKDLLISRDLHAPLFDKRAYGSDGEA